VSDDGGQYEPTPYDIGLTDVPDMSWPEYRQLPEQSWPICLGAVVTEPQAEHEAGL
jgi:hypothetical protein